MTDATTLRLEYLRQVKGWVPATARDVAEVLDQGELLLARLVTDDRVGPGEIVTIRDGLDALRIVLEKKETK